MLWEELTAKTFSESISKSEGVCILPIGVLEKHGDHLPLATDMYIVEALARQAANITPAVVFPSYFLGQIAEAKHEKGTIAPSHKLIMDALLEMCDEIHRNGFNKVFILNGHGGNNAFLPFFAQQMPGINRNYAVYTQFCHSMDEEQAQAILSHTGVKTLGMHAGFLETSLIMHLRPDLVNMDEVIPSEFDNLERLKGFDGLHIFTGFDWYAKFPHHFAGDPAEASASHGKFIFDILLNNVVKSINTIKADDVSLSLVNHYNKLTQHNRDCGEGSLP